MGKLERELITKALDAVEAALHTAKEKATRWTRDCDKQPTSKLCGDGLCPQCGSPFLCKLAWVENIEAGGFIDDIKPDEVPGIVPAIACFECRLYNIFPVSDREWEERQSRDELAADTHGEAEG